MLKAAVSTVRSADPSAPVVDAGSWRATPRCDTVAVVERATHDGIRNHVLTGHAEVGGPFAFVPAADGTIELRSGVAKQDTRGGGGYAQITIPRGVVEFHSHPAQCSTQSGTCAVALPSARDMVNIAIGFRDGVQVHLLYSQDGVYIIRVGEALGKLACADDDTGCCRLQRHLCAIMARLDGLHARFVRELEDTGTGKAGVSEGVLYSQHRRRWLADARELGFDIDLVSLDTRPRLRIAAPCGMRAGVTPIVTLDTRALADARCPAASTCQWLKEALSEGS